MTLTRTDAPKVSVVIPARNEAGHKFEALLRALDAQVTDFEFEVILVDSGSTDGTVELARRYGARVKEIPASEFDHGGTRNLGISMSRGEYVALVVGDAVPVDEHWLSAMVENLERDERVAGVYGRQIPHPEASILTRVHVSNLAIARSERLEKYAPDMEEYRIFSPKRRYRLAVFDDVSSCIRRSVWEEIPLDRTSFGEDVRWGKKAIEAGYKLVYEPRSAVYHSHERGALYDLKRRYTDQRILVELFNLELIPNLPGLVSATIRSYKRLYSLLRRDEEGASRGTAWAAFQAARHAACTELGNYLGVKRSWLARKSVGLMKKVRGSLPTKG